MEIEVGEQLARAFVVEQQAYFNVKDARVDWLRIMCSGYRPVPAPAR